MATYDPGNDYDADDWGGGDAFGGDETDPDDEFLDVEDDDVATAYCPQCRAEVYVDVEQCPYCHAYITPTTNLESGVGTAGRQVVVWLLITALVGFGILGWRWF